MSRSARADGGSGPEIRLRPAGGPGEPRLSETHATIAYRPTPSRVVMRRDPS